MRSPIARPTSTIDMPTAVVTSVGVLFLGMTGFSLVVFQQFPWYQTVGVALCFAAIVVGLVALFLRADVVGGWKPDVPSVGVGLAVGLALLVTAFSWPVETNPSWLPYYPAFPLLRLDAGGWIHQDQAFHVSLIQSILTFGYPSTGQNGAPFVPYHVLSHYVDAGILALTRLEPLDSYGLLFHFKVFAFLAAVVVFVGVISRGRKAWVFPLGVVFLVPVLISTWMAPGSHALWFTSLILVLSAPYVYSALTSDSPRPTTYVALFFIGASIGLGKVSSGLMFVVVVGAFLLLKNFRHRGPYMLLGAWGVFFAIYWRLFNTGHSSGLQVPTPGRALEFLNFFTTYGPGPVELNLAGLYAFIALFTLFAVIYRSRTGWLFAAATGVGLLAVTLVTQTLAGLIQPDVYYFIFGLFVSVSLLGVQYFYAQLSQKPLRLLAVDRRRPGTLATLLVVVLAASTLVMFRAPINIANPSAIVSSLSAGNNSYFASSNYGQSANAQLSVTGILTGAQPVRSSELTDVGQFRRALAMFMEKQGMEKRNTLLFVPKSTFADDLDYWGEPAWARGMTLYALTGVPLLRGIADASIKNFGQSSYDSTAIQVDADDLDVEDACDTGKNVIEVVDWRQRTFRVLCEAP